ncbi:MAG: DUF86 domain-containing protein [Ekhidna sp.]|uniref:HepT-like ribonuclease domain-containing protein n=1 Tax=Ekhidna sp. TaxID=2608089 RepID=UPI0032F06F24
MPKNSKAYLHDIRESIHRINRFIEDTVSLEAYANDDKTSSAVERQLSILGEAVVQFSKMDRLENAEKIKGFRNRLIHAYDSVDHETVWVIIKRYLPALLKEVDQKLSR